MSMRYTGWKKIPSCLIVILLVLATITLSSCSSKRKQDGPPRYNVDVSRIPNAKPRPLKRSKYGNMRSYRVFGKRYYPKKSSRNFQQVGVASWYGTKFHDRKTSSGEKYDMLAMTAAHKTLPLPTFVEVTNLKNHKKIIVKVNDRGPFASNRIIDLSYVAAKKLGMLGKGTAKVRIKAINPYRWAKNQGRKAGRYIRHKAARVKHAARRKIRSTKRYIYLQAGAFRKKAYATRLKKRLASMLHYPVRVHNPPAHSKLYRVRIGPIKDTASVKRIKKRLKKIGISPNKVKG